MYHIVFDAEPHLLTINWTGHVDVAEVQRCHQELQQHLAEIKPGLRILTDLSGLGSMDFECSAQIDRIMDLFNAAGVNTIVRIIPNPRKDIGFNIMSWFHYRHGIHIMTCETVEEAKRILQP
ncbi:MAG: STAS domain-containing protein [Verrucomicrobiia bacterium]